MPSKIIPYEQVCVQTKKNDTVIVSCYNNLRINLLYWGWKWTFKIRWLFMGIIAFFISCTELWIAPLKNGKKVCRSYSQTTGAKCLNNLSSLPAKQPPMYTRAFDKTQKLSVERKQPKMMVLFHIINCINILAIFQSNIITGRGLKLKLLL